MLWPNKNINNKRVPAKTMLARAIWRKRTKIFLRRRILGERQSPAFVILDAPSGVGKTHAIQELMKDKPNDSIKVMSCEMLTEKLVHHLCSRDHTAQNSWLMECLDGAKCLVVEDIDIVLAGKESTQKEIAYAFMKAIDEGITIIVTGINIKKKLPCFCQIIGSQCDCHIL